MNDSSQSTAYSAGANGEGPPVKVTLTHMKTSVRTKRLAQKLRKVLALWPAEPLPSEEQITAVERKISAEESLTKKDIPAVMAIVKRFSKSACIVRALAKTKQPGTGLAVMHLVNATTENVRCLEELPAHKLQYFAAFCTEFPVLASLRRTRKKLINKRIKEIGLGSELPPGYTVNARWKKDYFALVAEEILVEVFGGPPPDMSLKQWKDCWPYLRALIDIHLKENPSVLENLMSQVTVPSDKTPGRRKARVIENIGNRMRALVGLKGYR